MGETEQEQSIPRVIATELRSHAPFTLFGALTGIIAMVVLVLTHVPHHHLKPIFEGFHAVHVVLSAIVTTGLYHHYRTNIVYAAAIGLLGSIGIATLSDIIFPHHGAVLLLRATGEHAHHMHLHIAVIEHYYIIVPAALIGIGIGLVWPHTKVPHAGHVLLSTWASLFYIIGQSSEEINWLPRLPLVLVVLFVAVWVPCCVSDIVFPMLFVGKDGAHHNHGDGPAGD